MPGGMSGGMPGSESGQMPGGADGSDSQSGASSTTGEGGAYGSVGSVGERDSDGAESGSGTGDETAPGGLPEIPGASGASQGSAEDEFEKSLGDFDDSLLEEQQKVSQVSRDMDAFETNQAGGGVVGLGGQAGADGQRSGGSVGVVNTASGASGGNGREEAVGSVDTLTKQEIGERTPEDIPNGIDDDIVAKQLREAALAEEDPELRERLWDEYRAYKGL